MNYIYDEDLEFLQSIKSEDLEDLVYTLTHDKDGKKRISESLTSNNLYQEYHPDHQKYWREILTEVQHFGGNTIANKVRGSGVKYKEILIEVCEKLKVNFNKNASVQTIEENLLMSILTKALEHMSKEELKELGDAINIKDTTSLSSQVMLGIFQTIFKAGGFKSYQLTVIIANSILKTLIGRGLTFAGNAAITRTMAMLAGPIGWAVTGAWTAVDMAGPAYRVTIPVTIQIAVLRQKHLYNQTEKVAFS